MHTDRVQKRAFTLIELLVVVAIISLLLSILIPSLGAARALTRTTVCTSNMRQLAIGWTSYLTQSKDYLPGGSWDFYNKTNNSTTHPGYPVNYNTWVSLDWLGTIGETGDQLNDVPRAGSIYRLVGEQQEAYKCPEDRIDKAETPTGTLTNDTKYSYTAPTMLTGAKATLLGRTWWQENYPNTFVQGMYTQWQRYSISSLPWIMIEEDETRHLADVTDSAWGNTDRITQRHRGDRGTVGFIDGHATARKYQRELDAWFVYYELTDGRVVSGGPWESNNPNPNLRRPKFGYLSSRHVAGVVRQR
ncbi:MAG: prepilin-type N-terminal cleavage/methylation domain-containing protein [Phycisphaerae bacterium]